MVEKKTKHIVGKFMDPRTKSRARIVVAITNQWTNSPELNNQLKVGLLERILVRARSSENIQQLMASQAIFSISSKKKDEMAGISKGLDSFKSPSRGDPELIEAQAQGGLDKMAETCRRFLINPGKRSGQRKGAAKGLSYPARDADGKKKLVGEKPAMKAFIEVSKAWAPSRSSYEKQETNPERLKIRVKGNNVKAKYGALRCGDDRDADKGKAATDDITNLTMANHLR